MEKILVISILILAFSFGCEEETSTPKPQKIETFFTPLPPLGEDEEEIISFTSPRVGQESIYLGFTAFKERNGNGLGHFTYTEDTLWVEIVGRTNFVYDLEVRSSKSTEIDRYRMTRKNSSIEIALHNQEYAYYSLVTDIDLTFEEITEPVVSGDFESYAQQQCDSWPCFAALNNHEQLGQTYLSLNTCADFSAMEKDGPGVFCYYSGELGFVRWVQLSGFGRNRDGWDLLIKE